MGWERDQGEGGAENGRPGEQGDGPSRGGPRREPQHFR